MIRFLLDTGAVIALLDEPDGAVSRRARDCEPSEIGLSAIVAHELYFGACKSRRRERNLSIADALPLEVVAFDRDDARHAGDIRAVLAARGTPIGAFDTLIAGQARARALTLVTRNARELRRVDGLRLEDWSRGGLRQAEAAGRTRAGATAARRVARPWTWT